MLLHPLLSLLLSSQQAESCHEKQIKIVYLFLAQRGQSNGSLQGTCHLRFAVWFLYIFYILFYFFNPHLRICLLISERGDGRGGERVREKREHERETSIGWFPYVLSGGSNPQPRLFPEQEPNPGTCWCTTRRSNHPDWPALMFYSFKQQPQCMT